MLMNNPINIIHKDSKFTRLATNGFGDPYNSYAYSSTLFKGNLYVGTSRANLIFLKYGMPNVTMDYWPVPVIYDNYDCLFEANIAGAEIWRFKIQTNSWQKLHQSEYFPLPDGSSFRKHYGYRSMCSFKDRGVDNSLYVASTSRSRADGPDLLISYDGTKFKSIPKVLPAESEYSNLKPTSIRSLVQYEELLITTITGGAGGRVNAAGISVIFASSDPVRGKWYSINGNGFDHYPEVVVVYEICAFNGFLYAATAGINGFQVWKGNRISKYGFTWKQVCNFGAGRGPLNQGVICMHSFNDYLYLGSGIQNGGHDRTHNIGPAAGELLRLDKNDQIDIISGSSRDNKIPLSGYGPGFGNIFNAYIWKITSVNGKLLVGTMDWSVFGLFTKRENRKSLFGRTVDWETLTNYIATRGGAELWQSPDGVSWFPITINGFDNPYNFGIRNIVALNNKAYIGTANPFGPMVLSRTSDSDHGCFQSNPHGGCEIIKLRI